MAQVEGTTVSSGAKNNYATTYKKKKQVEGTTVMPASNAAKPAAPKTPVAPTYQTKKQVEGTTVMPASNAATPTASAGSSYTPTKTTTTPTNTLKSAGGTSGGTNTVRTGGSTSRDPVNTTRSNTTSTYTPLGTYNDRDMTKDDRATVDYYKSVYAEAQASGNREMMDWAHSQAEALRGSEQYGYSGGVDGSDYIPLQMTPQQQEVQSQAIQSVDSVMQGFRDLQNSTREYGDEGLVAIGHQWEQMNQMLNNLEAQITQQITSQMNGNDPAMQNAIRLIREEAKRMQNETMEELNARGLLQSGVYAKALSDMNNNELSQVQSAVASRFGDLQNQLNQAVLSIANTRVQALMTNQNSANSMLMNTQNNVFSAGLAGANAAVTMRGQDIQNQQFGQQLQYNYAGLNQDQRQFDSTMGFNRDKMATETQMFYDKLSQDDKQFYDSLSSSERMTYANIAASRGGQSAADQLARDKFEWAKQMDAAQLGQQQAEWNYSTNAQQVYDTNIQIGQAMSPGGIVDRAINDISQGKATMGLYDNMIRNGGYTKQAADAIIKAIQETPAVQAKINPSTKPKQDYTNQYYSPISGGYTPYNQQR